MADLVLLTGGWDRGAYRLNPSCHGRRLILGIVRASQGTRGFLKQRQGVGPHSGDIMIMIKICLHVGLFPEAERLHEADVVPVVAVDPGQVGPPDLHQLVGAEPARVGGLVVEISVSPL